MGNEPWLSTAMLSSKPGIASESTGEPNRFFNNSDSGIQQSSTLNESRVISNTDRLMAEATEIMDKMELLDAQYKKLLATKEAQSKDLETLNSTCKKQHIKIDSLKVLLVEKDNVESRATNAELEATIAREKIAELENKLKAKEEEVRKVSSKIEDAANSLMNRMKKIQKTLGPFDFDSSNMSKKDELHNRILEQQSSSLNVTQKMEDGDYVNARRKLQSEIEQLSNSLDVTGNMENGDYVNVQRKLEERMRNEQMQLSLKRLMAYMLRSASPQSTIGIKGMGELNPQPFVDECKKRFAGDDWCLKSMELYLLWQGHIQNPQWNPLKMDHERDGLLAIDEDDESLDELINEWGEKICKAVIEALLELEGYNPSGRYIVAKLWNFEKDEEVSLEEVTECLIPSIRPS